jgi:hypothetical protein
VWSHSRSQAFPQALKVDVEMRSPRTYDAIGMLEDLDDSLDAIRVLAGLKDAAKLPPETETQSHSNAYQECAHLVDREDPAVQRSVCEMYRVDYECFGYSLPQACS